MPHVFGTENVILKDTTINPSDCLCFLKTRLRKIKKIEKTCNDRYKIDHE